MITKIILLGIFLAPLLVIADEERIPFTHIFTKIPQTSVKAAKTATKKESLPYWGVLLGTTATSYYYDEKIAKNFRYHAKNWHINRHYRTTNTLGIKGNFFNFPTDLGSMLYFSGDGFIHIVTAGTFLGVGAIKKNHYTANTGTMILHGLMMTGLYSQLLKRSFGRESPVEKTHTRGRWHLFPSFHHYQSNTAKYDAMPSGHIMTATLTFTVLANRYEEHQIPIWTLGGLWIGSLGFQMINNGVHWASDYPLGIAMGYLIGKTVIKMHEPQESDKAKEKVSWTLYPSLDREAPGIYALAFF